MRAQCGRDASSVGNTPHAMRSMARPRLGFGRRDSLWVSVFGVRRGAHAARCARRDGGRHRPRLPHERWGPCLFADRSAELSGRARAAIEAQAHWLTRKSGLIIMVEGHADDSGTSDDNMTLSRLRADAVRQRLIELGVAKERILYHRPSAATRPLPTARVPCAPPRTDAR